MHLTVRWFLLVLCRSEPLAAQLPFYTDDPAVTEQGKWHLEFFNEYDALQLQFPNIRQNTANSKLNIFPISPFSVRWGLRMRLAGATSI